MQRKRLNLPPLESLILMILFSAWLFGIANSSFHLPVRFKLSLTKMPLPSLHAPYLNPPVVRVRFDLCAMHLYGRGCPIDIWLIYVVFSMFIDNFSLEFVYLSNVEVVKNEVCTSTGNVKFLHGVIIAFSCKEYRCFIASGCLKSISHVSSSPINFQTILSTLALCGSASTAASLSAVQLLTRHLQFGALQVFSHISIQDLFH